MYLEFGICIGLVVSGLYLSQARSSSRSSRRIRLNPDWWPPGISQHPNGLDRVLAMATTGQEQEDWADFVVRQMTFDPTKPLIIEVVDTSTSMGLLRDVFPAAHIAHRLRLLAEVGDRAQILQVHGWVRPELVDPRGVTTLGEYRALKAEDLQDARAEGQGILRGGSAISDWIRVVGELALAFKKAGVPRVALIILTDGWNRNGHIQNHLSRRWQNASEALAKDTINKLRQAFIAFHLIGFLRITDREKLERFVASIGLETGDGPGNSAKEVEINCYDPDNRGSIEDSVSRSLETSRHTFSRTVAP